MLGGCDSPECYSGTSLYYNSKEGLIIHDWVGMSEIPDYEKRVPANDETIGKHFHSLTPAGLKSCILKYILTCSYRET